ncbi:polymorphic outer membrane protein repeat-containing protein [Methanobrevibacter olleyae]|uniref:Polymorphic outer membrane protein repeat-containing protein n=1 Tax=Methanobrevibacter olleyae TaxID=294671 RepID=A0A1I4JZS0_METOL|nr:hypothetical protein [Methanobrevibacter olleyae]SFL72068.1 polymorphic outer membrane protein repeat-containing protein [Methanobrevibacter olleyae]
MVSNLNKIVILFLFLMFLSVAAVSAQDNTTSEIGLNENTATIDAGEIVEENLKVEPKEDSPIASEAEGKDDDVNVANVEMNEDNLKAPGSSFKDLQKLINDAKPGAVITLDKDYSYSPGNSEIVINKRITIDGKNHVLDGKLSTKILNITGNHVTLKNIKFINANITNDYDGGAIYWNGTYGKMSSCSFVNNHAESGSAVKWDGEYGNMSSCSFVNNHANYWGGAVNWWGDNGLLSACSFTNNHAGEHGGAISLSGENCTLSACSFTNNHANGFGGAVNLGNSYNVLKDCSFVNNRADRFGGAVAWDGDYGLLSACSFTNNHAEYYGGAVYWPGYNGTLEVCSFNNNHVNYDGGAVYWEADNGALSSCYFVNNHANDRGGAVAWDGDNGLLSYCSFVNNSAKYYGDAIYLYKNNTDVSACFFVIYRPKNTAVVKVDNLIYYRDSDYGVYYYENGNEIQSGLINDGYVTFYNLDNGKHEITMKFDKDGTEFTNYLTITGDSYLSASKVYMFYNDGTKYTIKLTNYKGNPLIYQNIQITIANKKYDIQTDSKGYATLTHSP